MQDRFHTDISPSNTEFLRRCARRMLNDAHSAEPSKALPIVRRVHAACVLPPARLTELYRNREAVRLKHVLNTIAAELGYADWTECIREVDRQPPAALDRFRMDVGAYGDYNKLWFADAASARSWQQSHGGHVVVYGAQAVVMT